MEDRQTWVDTLEALCPSVICGDFNAHHVSWDEHAQGMPRGAEINNLVEENEMAVLKDGMPTGAARFQQWCGLCAPHITIVNSEAADRFSWQPLNELSSDHSPILIKWTKLVKTERAQRKKETPWMGAHTHWLPSKTPAQPKSRYTPMGPPTKVP